MYICRSILIPAFLRTSFVADVYTYIHTFNVYVQMWVSSFTNKTYRYTYPVLVVYNDTFEYIHIYIIYTYIYYIYIYIYIIYIYIYYIIYIIYIYIYIESPISPWRSTYCRRAPACQARLREVFNHFDRDKSGRVDLQVQGRFNADFTNKMWILTRKNGDLTNKCW